MINQFNDLLPNSSMIRKIHKIDHTINDIFEYMNNIISQFHNMEQNFGMIINYFE